MRFVTPSAESRWRRSRPADQRPISANSAGGSSPATCCTTFRTRPTPRLRADYARFPWANDPVGLRAWQRGRTGFPIVDAGMRQLWATGWMHNRVRMIVASFLVKDLRISWLEGAQWFWDTLVDADLAANTLGWQWAAGCGADAAPYFRIFNPTSQAEKFDPDEAYVRSVGPASSARLPEPIVDHAEARKLALEALKAVSKKWIRGATVPGASPRELAPHYFFARTCPHLVDDPSCARGRHLGRRLLGLLRQRRRPGRVAGRLGIDRGHGEEGEGLVGRPSTPWPLWPPRRAASSPRPSHRSAPSRWRRRRAPRPWAAVLEAFGDRLELPIMALASPARLLGISQRHGRERLGTEAVGDVFARGRRRLRRGFPRRLAASPRPPPL